MQHGWYELRCTEAETCFVGGGVHSASVRIRTLAGPPLPHELVADTCRAIILTHTESIAAVDVDRDESASRERESW